MIIQLRRFITLTLLLTLAMPMAYGAKGTGKRIVDLAIHQEILLYSIVADYAMAGMGVDYHDPKANIGKEIITFEKNLKEIKQLSPEITSSGRAAVIDKGWKSISAILAIPIDQASALKLYEEAKRVEKEFEAIGEHQAEVDHDESETLLLLTGELGMESQRMAALYMIETWDVSVKKGVQKEIHEIFKEIEVIFSRITDLHATDPRTVKMVENLEKDVLLLEHLVDSDSSFPVLVAKSVEKIVSEVEELLVYVSGFISFLFADNSLISTAI